MAFGGTTKIVHIFQINSSARVSARCVTIMPS
jgi:hypothetical protein